MGFTRQRLFKDLFSEKNSKTPKSDHDSLQKNLKDNTIQLNRISDFEIFQWLIKIDSVPKFNLHNSD